MVNEPCKGCQRPIVWGVTAKGRRIPIDPEPAANGNLVVTDFGPPWRVSTVPKNEPALFGATVDRYVSHYATCPKADAFRRHGKKQQKEREVI